MIVTITGGTGLIGGHLITALRARGDEVRLLSRRAVEREGVACFAWDPMAGPPPPEALEGAEAVVHLAGAPVADRRWTAARKRVLIDSRVVGTRHLVAGIAAMARRPRVLISASGVGYYGPRLEPVDETAGSGDDFPSEICRQWEAEAGAAAGLGVRTVLLRTGLVLAREGGALPRLARIFRAFIGGRQGSGKQGSPWIHIADEIGLILHAIDHDEISGPLNAAAPATDDNAAFARALGKALSRPALFPVPTLFLRLLLGEMGGMVVTGQFVRPAVAERTGYRFRHVDLEAALRDLLAPPARS